MIEASQLKYNGPLINVRGNFPVSPGAKGKNTCPGKGAVPYGFAPLMLVIRYPAGSGCVKSKPFIVGSPVPVATANKTLGFIANTPLGVLKIPIKFLISSIDNDELAGCLPERPPRLSTPRESMIEVGSPELILINDVN